MYQLDGILEQKIEPGEGEQLFRLIFLREKALCQIARHEDKPRHVEKIDKGSHACGKGGMGFLQIAQHVSQNHQKNQNTLDVVDMKISCCLLLHDE